MAKVKTIEQIMKECQDLELGTPKKVSNNRFILYTTDKDRVGVLKMVADTFDGRYSSAKSGSGWKSSQGAALIGPITVLVKPGAKEGQVGNLAGLDARIFSKGGSPGKFAYAGSDVSVQSFTSAKQIEQSILNGIKAAHVLEDDLAETIESFFETGKLEWDPVLSPLIINKLGVYVGELLIGWSFFSHHRKWVFENDPFPQENPKAFHIPNDPSFSGVDSFVELKSGEFISISSKFGVGAKASFFSNLLEKAIKNRTKMKDSVLKKLVEYVASKGIDYKKSQAIVYGYGFEKILRTKVDLDKVWSDVKVGKRSADINKAILAIKSSKWTTDDINKKLPKSISAFFNRTLAAQLNGDEESLNQIVSILSGKDYWQANLNQNLWQKGTVKFRFTKAGKSKVKLTGNKSAIDDPSSKQGWINYELTQGKA
jgi:hypothetical protein